MKYILNVYDNNGLTEELVELPNKEDLTMEEIVKFAYSFNGYWYGGDLTNLQELYSTVNDQLAKNMLDNITINDLRACLFYLYRSVRNNVQQFGNSAYNKEEMIKLIDLIKKKMSKNLIH